MEHGNEKKMAAEDRYAFTAGKGRFEVWPHC